eukprot:SAG31_NODE_8496_length_1441_cov_1.161699_1_plen_262_part_00
MAENAGLQVAMAFIRSNFDQPKEFWQLTDGGSLGNEVHPLQDCSGLGQQAGETARVLAPEDSGLELRRVRSAGAEHERSQRAVAGIVGDVRSPLSTVVPDTASHMVANSRTASARPWLVHADENVPEILQTGELVEINLAGIEAALDSQLERQCGLLRLADCTFMQQPDRAVTRKKHGKKGKRKMVCHISARLDEEVRDHWMHSKVDLMIEPQAEATSYAVANWEPEPEGKTDSACTTTKTDRFNTVVVPKRQIRPNLHCP